MNDGNNYRQRMARAPRVVRRFFDRLRTQYHDREAFDRDLEAAAAAEHAAIKVTLTPADVAVHDAIFVTGQHQEIDLLTKWRVLLHSFEHALDGWEQTLKENPNDEDLTALVKRLRLQVAEIRRAYLRVCSSRPR